MLQRAQIEELLLSDRTLRYTDIGQYHQAFNYRK